MSSLGLSLLILIVVAIGALAAYNFWLTRKPKTRHDELSAGFSGGQMTRQEPSFDSGASEPYLDEMPDPAALTESQASNLTRAPAAAKFDSSLPSAADQASLAGGQPAESNAPSDWSAGVLPAAPPAPAAAPDQDLNWQTEVSPSPAKSDANAQFSSVEGSIEQAMRLQQEADEIIESAPSTQAAPPFEEPLTDPAQALPDLTEQNRPVAAADQEPAFESPTAGSPDRSLFPSPDSAPSQSERSAADTNNAAPNLPGQSLSDDSALKTFDHAASGGNQADAVPAPGWSGMDADRQAANFVATVNLELDGPIKGAKLISLTDGLTHAGNKPVRITAGNPPADGQAVVRTEPINPDGEYALLRLEVLQVNRHGPLDGVEYSSFVAAVDKIGESLGVLVNPPDMNVVLIKSRVLDAEVASLDAQVAINVETEQAIASEKFVSLAKEIDLAEGDKDGVFVARDNNGFVVYSVQLNAEENRVVLVLDVPRVPRELQPVRKMVEGAWAFAQGLNGKMIDDNGRAIDNALFERIESQIEMHYQALLAAGVPAGSDLARQVYNQV